MLNRQYHWIQGICWGLKQVSAGFGKSIVTNQWQFISGIMKAIPATDRDIHNKLVVGNTDDFFPEGEVVRG